jgi:hypothetical protein
MMFKKRFPKNRRYLPVSIGNSTFNARFGS